MTFSEQCRSFVGLRIAAVATLLLMFAAMPASAQTFTILHSFTGGVDGSEPLAGVILDHAGNIYGTTSGGALDGYCGQHDCGQAFRLSRRGSGWVLQSLHTFYGGSDGSTPLAKLLLAPDGTLYGTTYYGGGGSSCFDYTGCGTAFRLQASPSACRSVSCPWLETVLYSFQGGDDGANPSSGLVMDSAGNLNGVTVNSGDGSPYGCLGAGCGVLYQVARTPGGWTQSVLYAFTGFTDGGNPWGDMVLDRLGNLYGTGQVGGDEAGSVFQASRTGSGWTVRVIQWLIGTSAGIYSRGLTIDSAGNLYGGTAGEGPGGGGTVYELLPSNGRWNLDLLWSINGVYGDGASELVLDAAGNLYGVTLGDGAYGRGSVFKLTPSGGGWTYTDLHDFTGGSDGQAPYGPLAIDGAGNIYGVVSQGSSGGAGAVFEITP